MVMKEWEQKMIENEVEDDFGRPLSHPFVARTMMRKKLSEAALTFFALSSPRHPRGLVSQQVFLITRWIRCAKPGTSQQRGGKENEERREKF